MLSSVLRSKRDRMITKAVKEHGYSQVVARHVKLHYSTLSRIVKRMGEKRKQE